MDKPDNPVSLTSSVLEEVLRRLQQLEDEKAVLAVLHRYGVLSDHGTEAEWLDLFAPDAVLESRGPSKTVSTLLLRGGEATENGVRFAGLEKIAGFIAGRGRHGVWEAKHNTISPNVTINGDEATALSYFLAAAYHDGDHLIYGLGRFVDRLKRCDDGAWRFSERIVLVAGPAEAPVFPVPSR